MTEIAGYRLVSVVRAGGFGGQWFAEAADHRAVVVETCRPAAELCTRDGPDVLGRFLARRALQRRWADAIGGQHGGLGHGHVVPVLELGVTSWGGYAVRPRYDLTLGDLLRGGVRPRSDVLLELVRGIVSALDAIETAAGRPHGDLRPDSIMLDDLRPGRLRVGLAYPALPDELGDDLDAARREDLRRLGLLIYELVVGRPFRELGGYPVRDSEAWRALGADSGFWLGLVNALLNPKDRSLSLADVASRLAKVKHRKPGPGPVLIGGVAAAAVVLVAGVVVLLSMPRASTLPDVEFEVDQFRRWCEVSPGVLALREAVSALGEDAPAVLLNAVGTLDEGADKLARDFHGLDDFFDPNAAIEKVKYTRTAGGMRGLGSLVSGIEQFEQRVLGGEQIEGAEGQLEKLNKVAGVYTLAFERLDGTDDAPGFAAMFGREHWPARETVETIAESWRARPGWARAASLVEADLQTIDASVETLRLGVPFSPDGDETARVGQNPVQQRAFDAVHALVEAVGRLEDAAVWLPGIDGRLAELTDQAERLAAHAAPSRGGEVSAVLGGVDGALASALEKDPLLSSLPDLVANLGVLDSGQGLDVIRDRLDAIGRAFGHIQRVIDGGWDDLWVDVISMHRALGDRLGEMAVGVGSAAGAGEVSSWVDRRIGLCEDWAGAASRSPAKPPEEAPSARLHLAAPLELLRGRWAEAVDADAEASRNQARVLLDAQGEGGDVEELLDRLDGLIRRIGVWPAWPSLEDQIEADLDEASRLDAMLGDVVEEVYAVVLKDPEELIADWRAGKTLGAGVAGALARLPSLRSARDEIAGGMVRRWEAWRSGSNLGGDEIKRAAETRALRTGLKVFEDVLSRAVGRVMEVPESLRGVGGFDWEAFEPAAVRARAEAVAAALSGIDDSLWADRSAGVEGGAIDRAVGAALAESESVLEDLNRALERLAELRDQLDRCLLPGDEGGSEPAAVSALLGSLEGVYAPFVSASDDVHAVMSVAEEVETISAGDDLGELVARAEDVGPDGPHRAVRYAALRRADALARSGRDWPDDVASMRAEADRLREGFRRLLDELGNDAEAKARVISVVRGVLDGWWQRGFDVARSESDLAVLIDDVPGRLRAIGDGWGSFGDTGVLQGAALYNAGAYRARRALLSDAVETMRESKGATKTQAAAYQEAFKARAKQQIEMLRLLAGEALDSSARSAALRWIDEASKAIAEAKGGSAGWNENQHGPVGVNLPGWGVTLGENADGSARLEYSNGALSIVFDLIELPNGEKVFLAEDEFSVELLLEVLRRDTVRDALGAWFTEVARGPGHSRPKGPMAERIEQGRRRGRFEFGLWAHWLDDENTQYGPPVPSESFPAYPDGLVDPSDPVAIGPSQGRPSGKHPVTYVTFKAAGVIAEALGCRLPTVEEFRAALGMVPYPPESGVWNLRDGSTFPKQWAHYQRAFQNEVRNHYKPGDGCYDKRARASDDASVWAYRPIAGRPPETRLWFDPTGPLERQQGVRFRHLIGNVAEFVSSGGKPAAMGCSALSHPSVRPDRVVEKLRSVQGYADTGFRLAIDADDFGSLARTFERLLERSSASAYVFGGG